MLLTISQNRTLKLILFYFLTTFINYFKDIIYMYVSCSQKTNFKNLIFEKILLIIPATFFANKKNENLI